MLTLGHQAGKLWWLWLVTGIAWVVAALVILQFDSASVKTIGIIVGCMFLGRSGPSNSSSPWSPPGCAGCGRSSAWCS